MKTPVSSRKTNRAALMESASSSARNAQIETNEKRKHLQKTTRQTDLPRMIQKDEVSSTSFFDEDDSSDFVVKDNFFDTSHFSVAFKTSGSEYTLLSQEEVNRIRQANALPSERTSSLVSSSTEQFVVCIDEPVDTTKPSEIFTDTVLPQQMPAQDAWPFSLVEASAEDNEVDYKLNLLFDTIEQKDLRSLRALCTDPSFLSQLDLSAQDTHSGHTLLTLAVQTGDLSLVAQVLAMGANADVKNYLGQNAFQVAIHCKNLDILEFLFQKNPKMSNDRDFMRKLASDAVKTNQPFMLGYMLHMLETNLRNAVSLLRDANQGKKQFREKEAYGHFKAEYAPSKSEEDAIKQDEELLLKGIFAFAGLSLEQALRKAVSCGSDRVIPLLLGYGANVKLASKSCWDPTSSSFPLIWVAASKGHWLCVDALLSHGVALEEMNPTPSGWNGTDANWQLLHAAVTARQTSLMDADADCAKSSADD